MNLDLFIIIKLVYVNLFKTNHQLLLPPTPKTTHQNSQKHGNMGYLPWPFSWRKSVPLSLTMRRNANIWSSSSPVHGVDAYLRIKGWLSAESEARVAHRRETARWRDKKARAHHAARMWEELLEEEVGVRVKWGTRSKYQETSRPERTRDEQLTATMKHVRGVNTGMDTRIVMLNSCFMVESLIDYASSVDF